MRFVHRLRHGWEAFADRTGLRLLPPVGAALVVLALGILIPFLPRVDALPAGLEPSLASARITRFLRAHRELPDAGPSGAIFSPRPAFYWPERAGADSYAFRLYREDGAPQAAADGIARTFHMIPPPGKLEPGGYRFEVFAVVKGERIPWQERRFAVQRAPRQLRELMETMGMDLGGAESGYVLLGCYAELQSPHDVVSAFLQWKAATGEAGSLGTGPPSAWLGALAAR